MCISYSFLSVRPLSSFLISRHWGNQTPSTRLIWNNFTNLWTLAASTTFDPLLDLYKLAERKGWWAPYSGWPYSFHFPPLCFTAAGEEKKNPYAFCTEHLSFETSMCPSYMKSWECWDVIMCRKERNNDKMQNVERGKIRMDRQRRI